MKNINVAILFAVCLFGMYSCGIFDSNDSSDSNVSFTDGISDDVWEFMSDDLMDTVQDDLEIPIYRGDSPPIINETFETSSDDELVFLITPFELIQSTVPNDAGNVPGTFNDLYVKFSNQNQSNLTIDIELTHRNDPPIAGTGGYIIGNNDFFTIFGPLVQHNQSYEVHIVHIISGQLTSNGITNLSLGIVMIDNDGDPSTIPNETGRHFRDKDNLSELSSWPHSTPNTRIKESPEKNVMSNIAPF